MATFFLGTSALVKLYVVEPGSAWLRGIADPLANHDLTIAAVAGAEAIAAFARRLHAGSLTANNAATAMTQFRRDYARDYFRVQVTRSLLDRAMDLAEKHSLRGYDAIQLSAAITANMREVAAGLPPITLLSSDLELNAAALEEGLLVEDPNSHG